MTQGAVAVPHVLLTTPDECKLLFRPQTPGASLDGRSFLHDDDCVRDPEHATAIPGLTWFAP